jgi:hypothetical protein
MTEKPEQPERPEQPGRSDETQSYERADELRKLANYDKPETQEDVDQVPEFDDSGDPYGPRFWAQQDFDSDQEDIDRPHK